MCIVEWDFYICLIFCEVDGIVIFEDLIDGIFVDEQFDEVIGIVNCVIIDWCFSLCGENLKFVIVIIDVKGEVKEI